MNVCVIGKTVQTELFGTEPAVGKRIRIGGTAFRVAGSIGQKGESMMVNLDEVVLVPVANALRMFNRAGLFRIIVQSTASADLGAVQGRLVALLKERHDGEEDFTVLTPGAIAASLGAIIGIITAGLAGIAAVSLFVAGIGVMNVMIVSVTERTGEIGLMKAVGASNGQVLAIFLAEAVVLALIGGAIGMGSGMALAKLGTVLYPAIPFRVPGWALGLAGCGGGGWGWRGGWRRRWGWRLGLCRRCGRRGWSRWRR
jgi:putative ABC transport system permease protein